jgi:septal ring factor EnvC (AmiA/AmiB activator)
VIPGWGWVEPIRDILAALGGLALPGGVLWWWRDRRKAEAATEVAERTVDADVVVKDAGAWQARLAYVSDAFDHERQSLTHQIAYRDREIALRDQIIERLRADLAHQDEVIDLMRQQVDALEEQLTTASQQLSAVRTQLEHLAGDQNPTPEGSSA